VDKDRIEGSEKGIIGKIEEAQGALKLILEPIFEAEVRRSSRARHDARHTPRRLRIRRKSNPRGCRLKNNEAPANDRGCVADVSLPPAFVPSLRSYAAAASDLGITRRRERGRWRNNRAENSHQPTRRREYKIAGFQVPGVSPKISLNPRSHLQHFQRPTSSHFPGSCPPRPY
jgi:hypothetical protein